MSYEWAVKGGNDTDVWAADPKVVVVATGSHDCSRLVQALRHGNSEQFVLGQKIAASLNRSPLGRRVTELLKHHGGEDLTSVQRHWEYGIEVLRQPSETWSLVPGMRWSTLYDDEAEDKAIEQEHGARDHTVRVVRRSLGVGSWEQTT